MHITIDRAPLQAALKRAANVVASRDTIPILKHFKIEGRGKTLSVQATDMDREIGISTEAAVRTPGTVTAPAKLLAAIVGKLPEGAQVVLEAADEKAQLAVRAGRFRASLFTLPPEDFPNLAEGEAKWRFALAPGDVRRMIDTVGVAIGQDPQRPYLSGIYLHPVGKDSAARLRAVATNGHQLGYEDIPLPGGAEQLPGIIVADDAISVIRALADDAGDETLSFAVSERTIAVSVGETRFVSKLIEGTFPDYARVVPAGNDKRVRLDRDDLIAAVDRVGTVSRERGHSVKLSLERGSLMLVGADGDGASGEEQLDVVYDGAALQIGFNHRYLTEIAERVDGETIELALAEPALPALIAAPDTASPRFVLMPMRV